MAVVGDSRKGGSPIDLAEARRRREQASAEPDGTANGSESRESSTSSRPGGDRLAGWRFSDVVADDILQHHPEATKVVDEPADADEILRALEQAPYVPAPSVPKGTPRGSAQLAPGQPRKRQKLSASATRLHRPPVRRWVVGAAVGIAATAAIAILILTAQPAASGRSPGQPTTEASNAPSIALAGIVSGSFDTLARLHLQLHMRVPHTPPRAPAHKRRTPHTTRRHRTSSSLTYSPSGTDTASHASEPPTTTTSTSYTPASGGQTHVPQTQPQQPAFGAGGLLGPGSSPNG
jgi:hypothetical protein